MSTYHRALWAATVQIILSFSAASAAEDLIVNDFEGVDFGSWKATGEAFGKGPAQGPVEDQMGTGGFEGKASALGNELYLVKNQI